MPGTMFDGLRGVYPASEYPSRETALAIIAALDRMEDGSPTELERLSGIANVMVVANRAYMVYGHEALEPAAMARRMSAVYMQPKAHSAGQEGAAGGSDEARQPISPADPSASPEGVGRHHLSERHDGYGFTPSR